MDTMQSMDGTLAEWYSSYSLVTVERIFGVMGISLSKNDLLNLQPESAYYQLLQVPLKNIFNGILIDQTTDYREYGQKMLVDYLLSGAANQGESSPTGARLELEDMRTALISLGDTFDLLQFEHYKMINNSQKSLIALAKTLINAESISNPLPGDRVNTTINPLLEKIESIKLRIDGLRAQFHDMILDARALLNTLPDYFNAFAKDSAQLEELAFDTNLGEERE